MSETGENWSRRLPQLTSAEVIAEGKKPEPERRADNSRPSTERPLVGVRVLDATTDFAGRLCGRLFHDAGAFVVRFPRFRSDAEDSWGVFLDLGKAEPVSSDLRELALQVDIVLCTQLERDHGVDLHSLRELNPGLLIVSIPPFGAGPYETFRSDDVVLAALAGLADCTPGYPDRQEGQIQPPVQSLARLGEFGAGLIATIATLGALVPAYRSSTGPRLVEVAQLEALVSLMVMDWGTAAYAGTAPGRRRKARMLEPNLYVKSADGYLVIVATSDKHWAALVEAMETPAWARDERFSTVAARAENIEELHSRLREWARVNNGKALMERVQNNGVPCAAVINLATSLSSEQVRALGSVEVIADLTLPSDPIVLNGRRRAGRYVRVETPGTVATPASSRIEDSGPPLAGVRILDLTQMVAGPLAGQFLAALGADVVLVESRRRPVPRMYGPFAGKPEYDASANFNHVNRGKRSVELDLKTEEGRRLLAALVRKSDVVLENFSKRAAEDLGLTYPKLRVVRDDVIVASISAFGRSGPWGHYVANHAGVTALAGLASAIRDSEGRPRLVGAVMPDTLTGCYMAVAVLQALILRAQTGHGFGIEISMLDVMLNSMGGLLTAAAAGGSLPPHPAKFLTTSEPGKYIALSESEVAPAIADMIRTIPRAAGMTALQARGFRAGAVQDLLEVIADPHLAARRFVQQVDHPVVGTRPIQGVPWTYDGRRPWLGAAPPLGSDTESVLRDLLDLQPSEIARLRESGVLR